MAEKEKPHWLRMVELGAARMVALKLQLLPHTFAQRIMAGLAVLIHDLIGIRKEHARREMQRAYPHWSPAFVRRMVRRVYAHFGAVAAELARIPTLARGGEFAWVHVDEGSQALLRQAREEGRGGLVISGHLGNWEMAGAWCSRAGFKVNYVVGRQSNPMIEELLDQFRRSAGIGIIKRDEAGRGVIKALRGNSLVAMLIDQDARRHGVFVPFFGRPASTPRGVATFARKMKPKLLMMNTWRDSRGVIQVRLEELHPRWTGNREEDILRLTAQMTAKLETYIRQNPDQWLWLHRRWKSLPTH